jgi:superoxide dismutase, Fe-Mn family
MGPGAAMRQNAAMQFPILSEAFMTNGHLYKVRQELRPKSLHGISEEQISQHWALYQGYVKNANTLSEKIAELAKKGDFGPEFAEMKRRMAFEKNGMILHEHYFAALKAGQKAPGDDSELIKNFKTFWGGFDSWKKEFSAMGAMRGIGWVILYFDPEHRVLSNHWIDLHENGHPAGFAPILVMDVWEHAYMVDLGANGRGSYVDLFLKNVNWPLVERTLKIALQSQAGIPAAQLPAETR